MTIPPGKPDPKEKVCPTCKGAKVIVDTSEDTDISPPPKRCPTCKGKGKVKKGLPVKKRRKVLVTRVWHASNLTWREAEKIVDDAIRLGQFMAWEKDRGNKRDNGNVAA